MAVFIYKARNPAGQVVSSTMEAETETAVRSRLRERNFIITSIREKKKGFDLGDITGQFQRVKQKSLAVFSRQFSTMVTAGLSLVRALDVLEQQCDDKKLKEVISDVRRKVEGGSSLSEAFQEHSTVFSDLYIHLTRAGEVGGVLDETLDRVADFLEKDQRLRAKIKSSMTYPVAIMIFAVIIVLGLVVFVIPTFQSIFEGLGIKLPVMTQFLITLSIILRTKPLHILVTIIVLVIGFRAYVRSPRGKFQYHKLMFKLPVFGLLMRKITISRFTRTLGTLLSSGVPVMQAMEVTGKASGNMVVEKAVEEVRESLREGESISAPMERSGIFPPMVTQMIAVGEETGSLDKMLEKISDFYDMEVETTLDALTSLLEPLMLIFIGAAIGFIVISMFLPMLSIINSL
ncbi:MAG: type II secretion system F family protein [bacterium]